jgi:hypothetical protein
MNATALFLEPATRMETRELQPLPDASEAAWDRWMIEVGGADYLAWQATCRHSAPKPSIEQQLRAYLSDE